MSATQSPYYLLAFDRLAHFVAATRRKWRSSRDLQALAPSELSLIATDLGLTESQLRKLVLKGETFPEALRQMAAALEIGDSKLESDPSLRRDMQALCSLCDSKRRCQRELRNGSAAAHYREFCPNAPNLEYLAARDRDVKSDRKRPVESCV
jgi:hypothetical protein